MCGTEVEGIGFDVIQNVIDILEEIGATVDILTKI